MIAKRKSAARKARKQYRRNRLEWERKHLGGGPLEREIKALMEGPSVVLQAERACQAATDDKTVD
jgi:uncharacterized protein (DUF1786 family)